MPSVGQHVQSSSSALSDCSPTSCHSLMHRRLRICWCLLAAQPSRCSYAAWIQDSGSEFTCPYMVKASHKGPLSPQRMRLTKRSAASSDFSAPAATREHRYQCFGACQGPALAPDTSNLSMLLAQEVHDASGAKSLWVSCVVSGKQSLGGLFMILGC